MNRVGLIPSLLGIVALLFALKAGGLAFTAIAEEHAPDIASPETAKDTVPTAAKPGISAPKDFFAPAEAAGGVQAAPAATLPPASAGASAAEVDVLSSLSDRRTTLDAREQTLELRENLIAAAERRVDGKIAELKTIESTIEDLLGTREGAEENQLVALVKMYEAMKAKDASRIFETLDEPILLSVAGRMKPEVLAQVMAAMTPDRAQKLTVKLARRFDLPEPTKEVPQVAEAPAPTPPVLSAIEPAVQAAEVAAPAAAPAAESQDGAESGSGGG